MSFWEGYVLGRKGGLSEVLAARSQEKEHQRLFETANKPRTSKRIERIRDKIK